jgi:predicted amidophosphoribosyltransferase
MLMAMRNCYDCGKPISKSARVCPHCGRKNANVNPLHVKIAFVTIGVCLVLFVLFIMFASN